MVMHTSNPGTWHAKGGGLKFEARLSYIARTCLKKKKKKKERKRKKNESKRE
jgi:hypothetical protein